VNKGDWGKKRVKEQPLEVMNNGFFLKKEKKTVCRVWKTKSKKVESRWRAGGGRWGLTGGVWKGENYYLSNQVVPRNCVELKPANVVTELRLDGKHD